MIINNDFISTICRAQAQDEEQCAKGEILQSRSNHKDFILKSEVLHQIVNDEEFLVIPKGLPYVSVVPKKTKKKKTKSANRNC